LKIVSHTQSYGVSDIGAITKAVEEELGRPVSWTWNLSGQLIDEISKDDCIAIANWLRRRAKAALRGETIPSQTIELVRRFYDGILIVGGGITSADKARKAASAGANILVIANPLQTPRYEIALHEIAQTIQKK
jgi:hypothetical protein